MLNTWINLINVCQSPLVSNNQRAIISMCSLNVCGLHSKLKYNILQNYIKKYDVITETEGDSIDVDIISGYKCFIMSKKITDMEASMVFVFW